MKMLRLSIVAGVIMALAVSACSAATYGTVKATIGQGYGITMATMIQPYDSSWWSGYTGSFNLTYSNYNGVWQQNPLSTIAFCTEVETVNWGGTYSYTIKDAKDVPVPDGPADTNKGPMGALKAAYVSELWGKFINQVTDNVSGAAFQIALYEIVFEDLYVQNPPGWSFSTGKFQARNDSGDPAQAISLASSWLSQINGQGAKAGVVGLTANGVQDLIVGCPPVIPEASTVMLALMGLGSVAGFRRLRRG